VARNKQVARVLLFLLRIIIDGRRDLLEDQIEIGLDDLGWNVLWKDVLELDDNDWALLMNEIGEEDQYVDRFNLGQDININLQAIADKPDVQDIRIIHPTIHRRAQDVHLYTINDLHHILLEMF